MLRLFLLPIVFAGDRLVAHPTVGTSDFDLVFAVACVYSVIVALESFRADGPRVTPGMLLGCDLLLVAALTYESGGAFSQLHAAFLALPLGAALLLSPRPTAALSLATGVVYLVVAIVHPATSGTKRLDVALAQGLYVVWVGSAAVVLSWLLSRRRRRILELAAARGRLVAEAVDAEEQARKRLSDDLHDHAIQNVLTARQDVADARAGDNSALDRADLALRLGLEQLRSAVRQLHPYLLDHLDLPSALRTTGEEQAARGGYELELGIDPGVTGTNDRLILSLARELLANAAKHANATRVNLQLLRRGDELVLEITDDGIGFSADDQLAALRDGHIGLASTRERVEACGGKFELASRSGVGTRVRCTIPSGPLRPSSDHDELNRSEGFLPQPSGAPSEAHKQQPRPHAANKHRRNHTPREVS